MLLSLLGRKEEEERYAKGKKDARRMSEIMESKNEESQRHCNIVPE